VKASNTVFNTAAYFSYLTLDRQIISENIYDWHLVLLWCTFGMPCDLPLWYSLTVEQAHARIKSEIFWFRMAMGYFAQPYPILRG